MAITSVDILNLSHSLKDICEVNCNTPECLSQTLKILLQYNLIQANLQFSRQFEPICMQPATQVVCAEPCSSAQAVCPPSNAPVISPKAPETSPVASAPADNVSSTKPIRLDIGDPFLADFEK